MNTTIDSTMIKRAQAGDSKVISALYENFHLGIYRYLYFRVGDPALAEDLAAEVFLRMIYSLPSYSPRNVSFQAWLFQIAHNLTIDHYRKAKFRNHASLEENMVAHEEPVDTTVQKNLDSENLRQALDRLSEDQREVITLRFVAAMPIAEVARTMHKSENAIKAIQRRALVILRELLREWEISYV